MGDAAVVGAGVLGLAVAHRLRDRGENVTLFEAEAEVGGPARSHQRDGLTWDRQWHFTLPTDGRTLQLLRRLGIEHEVHWTRASAALVPRAGSAAPCSTALDLLRLPGLRSVDRARVLATTARAARRVPPERLRERTASDWLTASSGRRALDGYWRPVMRAGLGDGWADAGALVAAGTIRRLHSAKGGVLRRELVGSTSAGFGAVVERYASWLTDVGVKMNTGTPVRRIRRRRDGLDVEIDDGSANFDQVVVTTAAPTAASICPGLTGDEHEALRRVQYVGLICPSVLFPYEVSPHLVTYVGDTSLPFSSVVEMTRLVDRSRLDGCSLVYLPRFTTPADPMFDLDDDELGERFVRALTKVYPNARRQHVIASNVFRLRHAVALPVTGGDRPSVPFLTTVEGLQLLGSAHIASAPAMVEDVLALVQELR